MFTQGLFAMTPLAYSGPMALRFTTLVVALLLPGLASAGWGDENWGEMVWGATPPIPAMSTERLIVLGVLLLLAGTLLVRRRRRLTP
jgi:hypothetical protein